MKPTPSNVVEIPITIAFAGFEPYMLFLATLSQQSDTQQRGLALTEAGLTRIALCQVGRQDPNQAHGCDEVERDHLLPQIHIACTGSDLIHKLASALSWCNDHAS